MRQAAMLDGADSGCKDLLRETHPMYVRTNQLRSHESHCVTRTISVGL